MQERKTSSNELGMRLALCTARVSYSSSMSIEANQICSAGMAKKEEGDPEVARLLCLEDLM